MEFRVKIFKLTIRFWIGKEPDECNIHSLDRNGVCFKCKKNPLNN